MAVCTLSNCLASPNQLLTPGAFPRSRGAVLVTNPLPKLARSYNGRCDGGLQSFMQCEVDLTERELLCGLEHSEINYRGGWVLESRMGMGKVLPGEFS